MISLSGNILVGVGRSARLGVKKYAISYFYGGPGGKAPGSYKFFSKTLGETRTKILICSRDTSKECIDFRVLGYRHSVLMLSELWLVIIYISQSDVHFRRA